MRKKTILIWDEKNGLSNKIFYSSLDKYILFLLKLLNSMKIHYVFFVSLLEFKLCKNNLKDNFIFFISANAKLYNAYTLH
jgi:hypothetical protein